MNPLTSSISSIRLSSCRRGSGKTVSACSPFIPPDLQVDLNHNSRLDSIERDCKVRGAAGNAFDAAGNTDQTAGAGSGRAATADSSDSSGIADTGDPKKNHNTVGNIDCEPPEYRSTTVQKRAIAKKNAFIGIPSSGRLERDKESTEQKRYHCLNGKNDRDNTLLLNDF